MGRHHRISARRCCQSALFAMIDFKKSANVFSATNRTPINTDIAIAVKGAVYPIGNITSLESLAATPSFDLTYILPNECNPTALTVMPNIHPSAINKNT